MDTDSAYFALSYNTLEEAVKPRLVNEFTSRIADSCQVRKFEASEEYWFPRECCQKHIKFDRRSADFSNWRQRALKCLH